ncbi:MAG: ribonuclease HII [bacterium]|nr:ribonuclease HII [bacterium]
MLLQNNIGAVIGCDEVGRGSLAGPVVAAAVTFTKPVRAPKWWKYVTDSKRLSAVQRSELAQQILDIAAGWGIGVVEHNTIDEINIHHASLHAMKLAVHQVMEKLQIDNIHVLIDGKFKIPGCGFEQQAIVKGDSKVHSIAAASIVAKVYRDNVMKLLHEVYPEYQFDEHKGYATKKHRAAIVRYGLSTVHRVSFCDTIV